MSDLPDLEDPWVLLHCNDINGRPVLWANPRDTLEQTAESFEKVFHRMDDPVGYHLQTLEVTVTNPDDGTDTVFVLDKSAIYVVLEQVWKTLRESPRA